MFKPSQNNNSAYINIMCFIYHINLVNIRSLRSNTWRRDKTVMAKNICLLNYPLKFSRKLLHFISDTGWKTSMWKHTFLWTPYLCSCSHPRETHSSEHHYKPECCWCTCCCDRRMCWPNMELQNRVFNEMKATWMMQYQYCPHDGPLTQHVWNLAPLVSLIVFVMQNYWSTVFWHC